MPYPSLAPRPTRFARVSGLSLLLALLPGSSQAGEAVSNRPGSELPSPEARTELPRDGGPDFNRLIHETSPYLLQHATNPVDWYPWGEEALRRARELDRPIFLSIGYSTCHWCHVMERESFEDPEVASFLNTHYVPIKVDREERPDLDHLYMGATQVITGRGGWPTSVWLTPSGAPYQAGTYFRRDAFLARLGVLLRAWEQDRERVEAQARRIQEAMQELGRVAPNDATQSVGLDQDLLEVAVRAQLSRFDEEHGGFGDAPKFPAHPTRRLWLHLADRGRQDLGSRLEKTLDRMILGGIHDHVGGGFHRYSTDRRWLLPHFEKMLYDNGPLLEDLARMNSRTTDRRYSRAAEALAAWVLREMRDPETGAFYSALDADSAGEEGLFYQWTPDQLEEVLGPDDAMVFRVVYGVTSEGNVPDLETGEPTGRSVLARLGTWRFLGDRLGVPEELLRRQMRDARARLRVARDQRPRPARDDKIVTSWNALMIQGLAVAGSLLARPEWVGAARRAGDFLWTAMRPEGRLQRTYRLGVARIPGFLEDHALLARAYLSLADATGSDLWRRRARTLADEIHERFRDPEGGGLFRTSAAHEALLIRSKSPLDSAVAAGAGVAAQVYVALAAGEDGAPSRARARELLEALAPTLRRFPVGCQSTALALAAWLDLPEPESPTEEPKDQRPTASLRQYPLDLVGRVTSATASHGPAPEEGRLEVEVSLDPGWHIQSAEPGVPDLIPSRLQVEPVPGLVLGETEYPAGRPRRLSFTTQPLRLWEGEVQVEVPLLAVPGDLDVLEVSLAYQACDAQRCLAPTTATLGISLEMFHGKQDGGSP